MRSGRRVRAIASASTPLPATVTGIAGALEIVPRDLRDPRLIVHDQDVLHRVGPYSLLPRLIGRRLLLVCPPVPFVERRRNSR